MIYNSGWKEVWQNYEEEKISTCQKLLRKLETVFHSILTVSTFLRSFVCFCSLLLFSFTIWVCRVKIKIKIKHKISMFSIYFIRISTIFFTTSEWEHFPTFFRLKFLRSLLHDVNYLCEMMNEYIFEVLAIFEKFERFKRCLSHRLICRGW